MSVHCPRCDAVIPEKVFREIHEWGPEAMKCPYCDCPLNKSILGKQYWNRLFPVPEKTDEDPTRLLINKTREVTAQVKKAAAEFKKDYIG